MFGGFALAALLSIATASLARAQPAPARPSDAPLPSCLDQTIKEQLSAELKPRGVQKRNFAKNKKIVLVGHGGLFGGDLTSSSWIAGGALGFFFTEDFGIQGEFDLTPLTLDLDAYLDRSIEKIAKGREGQPEQTAAFARAYPDKLIGFMSVHPAEGDVVGHGLGNLVHVDEVGRLALLAV